MSVEDGEEFLRLGEEVEGLDVEVEEDEEEGGFLG